MKDYIGYITASVLGIIIGAILINRLKFIEDIFCNTMMLILSLIFIIPSIGTLIWVLCSLREDY